MKSTRIAILSALFASVCCVGPLVLIAFGLGTLGLGVVIGRYHWAFLTVGVLMILFSWRRYFREKKKCRINKCKMENKRITQIILSVTTAIVLFFLGLNLYTFTGRSVNAASVAPVVGVKTIAIPVEGMTCFTCEVAVSTALKRVDGVVNAQASAKKGVAMVSYDPDKTDIKQLIDTIDKTGYKASLPK